MIKKIFLALTSFAAMGWSVAQADPITITLNDWNVTEIENAGDIVTVAIGTDASGDNTVLTVQWFEGSTSDDLWTALGLDQFYFNSYATVTSVYEGATAVSWTQQTGGTAGDFGTFLSWEREGGSTGGIGDPIYFTFAGLATFGTNTAGNQFAAHVRYGGDPGCSGFVGGPNSTTPSASDSNCGTTQVPEPATLALFGLGLIGFGLGRRRKS